MSVRGLAVADTPVSDIWWLATVHWDAGGGWRLPGPHLTAGGVVRAQQVVTLPTLVVGNLTVRSPAHHGLAIPDSERLTHDVATPGHRPAPVPGGAAHHGLAQQVLQLVARVTAVGEDSPRHQGVRQPTYHVPVLHTDM